MMCHTRRSMMPVNTEEMGQHWVQKMLTFFSIFDTDEDGVVSENDVKGAVRSAALDFLQPTQIRKIRRLLGFYWRHFFLPAVANNGEGDEDDVNSCDSCSPPSSHSPTVTSDAFVGHMVELVSLQSNRRKFLAAIKEIGNWFYDSIDLDHNDKVELKEMTTTMVCFQVASEEVEEFFQRLDVEGVGWVGRKDIHQALCRFFASRQEDVGSVLFGKLKNVRHCSRSDSYLSEGCKSV